MRPPWGRLRAPCLGRLRAMLQQHFPPLSHFPYVPYYVLTAHHTLRVPAVGPRGPPAQPVFGPAHTITGAHSKHPNTTPTRDSVRVATVPFALSTWRYSPSTYSEKSRSPVTNHGQTTPMLGFPPVYRYPYGTSKPQTRPVDAISPFSNMAHSAPRRVA